MQIKNKLLMVILASFLFLIPLSMALDCGDVLNSTGTYTLTSDVYQSSGICILVNGSDITVDCNGYTIYTNGSNVQAINVISSVSNTLIQNCNIEDLQESETSYGVVTGSGLTFDNGTINFTSSSTSRAFLTASYSGYLRIYNSTLNVDTGNLINAVSAVGSSRLDIQDTYMTFSNGGITISGSSWRFGSMERSTLITDSSTALAIDATVEIGDGGTITDSRIVSPSIISTYGNSGGSWTYTNVILDGSNGNGTNMIYHRPSFDTKQHTFTNVTFIRGTATTNWYKTDRAGTSVGNWYNVTFQSGEGSIKIDSMTTPDDTTLAVAEINVNENSAYANSVSQPQLNTSAIITLNNPASWRNKVIVDFEDDGTFEDCPASICTVLDSGTPAIFEVAHFTNYSTEHLIVCETVNPANYSIVDGYLIANDSSELIGSNVNITYDYDYIVPSEAGNVAEETSTAIAGVTNWFPIILVITAMIVLIILTVIIITAIKGSGLTGGTA